METYRLKGWKSAKIVMPDGAEFTWNSLSEETKNRFNHFLESDYSQPKKPIKKKKQKLSKEEAREISKIRKRALRAKLRAHIPHEGRIYRGVPVMTKEERLARKRENMKKYRKENPDKFRARDKRYREKKKHDSSSF